MQLIDKKGKLFGLINLIDLIVVIIILFLIFGACFKISQKSALLGQQVTVQNIEMDLFLKKVMLPFTKSFQEGDVIKDSITGIILGTVKEIRVEPHREAIADSQGNLVNVDVPERYNVILTLEGKAECRPEGIKIRGLEILGGNIHIVQSNKSKAEAVMLDVRY
ncbi:MAG TPA: DUF4330 domain-containing protein [Clostridia bacterium]|nr:DUF4330 domain-containing protein [Clostridia bacterium]